MLLCVTTFVAGLILILVELNGKWAVSLKLLKPHFCLKLELGKKCSAKKNFRFKPIAFSQLTEAYLGPLQTSVVVQLLTAFAKSSTINVWYRSSRWQMFFKIGVLRYVFNIHRETPMLESLFNFIKKETPAQVFSCEYCENFKNSFLHRTLPVAAFFDTILYGPRHFQNGNFTRNIFKWNTWWLSKILCVH